MCHIQPNWRQSNCYTCTKVIADVTLLKWIYSKRNQLRYEGKSCTDGRFHWSRWVWIRVFVSYFQLHFAKCIFNLFYLFLHATGNSNNFILEFLHLIRIRNLTHYDLNKMFVIFFFFKFHSSKLVSGTHFTISQHWLDNVLAPNSRRHTIRRHHSAMTIYNRRDKFHDGFWCNLLRYA